MAVLFSNKAETLENLAPILTNGKILPVFRFTIQNWESNKDDICKKFQALEWSNEAIIVRSSAQNEDDFVDSNAGHYSTVENVKGQAAFSDAVDSVISSFDGDQKNDQVFIQPYLENAVLSGVAFSADPNTGAPYIIINYNDDNEDTSMVTAGKSNDVKTYIIAKSDKGKAEAKLKPVINVLEELEKLFEINNIDIEFAIDRAGNLVLFQARPLVINVSNSLSVQDHQSSLSAICKKIDDVNKPHPYLFGDRTLFGIMPDWNPAEIIGVRPRPLALSLYKELITDSIWAYQRNNYGYKNLRSFPLLVDFQGLPYIDVRVSFNSFIPRDIDNELGSRLVNYYLDRLDESPNLHDKVEFDIIFSCYTADIEERVAVLKDHGFSDRETKSLTQSLKSLTNNIIHSKEGLWLKDYNKFKDLEARHETIMNCDMSKISQIYWILEDCKRYGTLPFAGLARAGFIAVQFLRSLVNVGVLAYEDYHHFINCLDTISGRITRDYYNLDKDNFLKIYGHLRPGTYDILSARYDELPDLYFDWDNKSEQDNSKQKFSLTVEQMRSIHDLLESHKLNDDVIGLFNFLQQSIEGREYGKFLFTRNLSDAMNLLKEVGQDYGIDPEDISYASISVIYSLYSSTVNAKDLLLESIERGKKQYEITQSIILPPLIRTSEDVWGFEMPVSEPNFITLKSVMAEIADHEQRQNLKGRIVMIPNADPGFDWIFSHDIGGLITAYGGVNSHMAIRAGELGIPAVIGAGEVLFKKWRGAEFLHVDCANRRVEIIKNSDRPAILSDYQENI